MLRLRLWLTIVNDETARQGVERGRNGALMCALFFAFLAFDGWTGHHGQGTEGMAFFAVLFVLAGWRIHRASARMMDLAMVLFPFGVGAALQTPAMRSGGRWSGTAYLFVLVGFELLNGVRGASYLQAELGVPSRGDVGEPGETGGGMEPNSPLLPRGEQTTEPI